MWSSDAAIRRLPPRRPALATIYRDMVETFEASLRQPDIGREASEVIPGLIDGIIILTPVDGKKGARKDNTASMSLKCHQRTSK